MTFAQGDCAHIPQRKQHDEVSAMCVLRHQEAGEDGCLIFFEDRALAKVHELATAVYQIRGHIKGRTLLPFPQVTLRVKQTVGASLKSYMKRVRGRLFTRRNESVRAMGKRWKHWKSIRFHFIFWRWTRCWKTTLKASSWSGPTRYPWPVHFQMTWTTSTNDRNKSLTLCFSDRGGLEQGFCGGSQQRVEPRPDDWDQVLGGKGGAQGKRIIYIHLVLEHGLIFLSVHQPGVLVRADEGRHDEEDGVDPERDGQRLLPHLQVHVPQRGRRSQRVPWHHHAPQAPCWTLWGWKENEKRQNCRPSSSQALEAGDFADVRPLFAPLMHTVLI